MYAIIETGGKQIKVEVGDTIFVEKLDVEVGEKVVFDKVLFVGDKTAKLGAPYVEGATVEATVEKQGKEKKVLSTNIILKNIIIKNKVIDNLIQN